MNTELRDKLVGADVSPTLQRLAVFENLVNRCDHPSVDDVYLALRDEIPTLSKTTVYSALQLLSEKGLIGAVHVGGGELHYDGKIDFHAHFRCRMCSTIYDVYPMKEHRSAYVPLPEGFQSESEELIYHGVCSTCAKKENDHGTQRFEDGEESVGGVCG